MTNISLIVVERHELPAYYVVNKILRIIEGCLT